SDNLCVKNETKCFNYKGSHYNFDICVINDEFYFVRCGEFFHFNINTGEFKLTNSYNVLYIYNGRIMKNYKYMLEFDFKHVLDVIENENYVVINEWSKLHIYEKKISNKKRKR